MNESNDSQTVWWNGREYNVRHAHLYASDYFDIWLQDIQTDQLIACTAPISETSLKARQVLVLDEYLSSLSDAGIVRPTGETVETSRHGTLHKCDVPVREIDRTVADRGSELREDGREDLDQELDDDFQL